MKNRELILNLNQVDMADVREKFSVGLSSIRRDIRTPIDVLIKELGYSYEDAVHQLAEAFPLVASGEHIITPPEECSATDLIAASKLSHPKYKKLAKLAHIAIKQLHIMGAPRFTINVRASKKEDCFTTGTKYSHGIYIEQLLDMFPFLASQNVNKADIFLALHHTDKRISLYIDDAKESFYTKHRPSILLETSDRSVQAHYVLEKKYGEDFYHWATAKLNFRYGDPAVQKAHHNTRLAGFSNSKKPMLDGSGRYPFVEIRECTRHRCVSLEAHLDTLYKQYTLINLETAPQAQPSQNLSLVPIPDHLIKAGLAYQTNIVRKYSPNLDRSRADSMIGRFLYSLDASQEEVFSWLMLHATQKDKHKEKALLRYATLTSQYCKSRLVGAKDTEFLP